jgi:hypothetical protein
MLYKNIDGVDTPMTAEEEAEHLASLRPRIEVVTEKVRLLRNNLLANTDWTQAKDMPDAVSVKWAPYRQALRDVPQQTGFPENVQWPTQPE